MELLSGFLTSFLKTPPETGLICSTCKHVIEYPESTTFGRGHDQKRSSSRTHQPSLASFKASIAAGCLICSDIYRALPGLNLDSELAPTADDVFSVFDMKYRRPGSAVTLDGPDIVFTVKSHVAEEEKKIKRTLLKTKRSAWLKQNNHMEDGDLSSTRCFNLINNWVNECEAKHTNCIRNLVGQSFQFPTRLLEMRGASSPALRIVDTRREPITGPYNTLSYCWGTTVGLRLLSTNSDRLHSSFAVDELPKTLADAIEVTRSMGVPYLWIDALCIIQDSVSDWQTEAVRMTDVYSNSYCNIAATHTKDANDGLFINRHQQTLQPVLVTIKYGWYPPETMRLHSLDFWRDRVDLAPLNGRGWVLQERELARRTLHFCYDQILFQCYQVDRCESWSSAIPGLSSLKRQPLATIRPVTMLSHAWIEMLGEYSRCQLTRETDRLIAFAGIAERVAAQLGEEYIAGLWRHELPRNLLWQIAEPKLARREQEYHAPSWSWASVNGPLMNRYIYNSQGRCLVEVLGYEVKTVDNNPFSPVTDAHLNLRCQLFSARPILSDNQELLSLELAYGGATEVIESSSSLKTSVENMADVQADIGRSRALSCTPIIVNDYDDTTWIEWLVLESAGTDSNTYRRFGTFYCRCDMEGPLVDDHPVLKHVLPEYLAGTLLITII